MNGAFLLRAFFILIISVTMAYQAYEILHPDAEDLDNDRPRYRIILPNALLPAFLVTLTLVDLFLLGPMTAARSILSMCFGIFLHISIYYAVLLLAMPFFRQRISARACSILWMVPNYLYVTRLGYMSPPAPKLVLRIPEAAAFWIFGIWAAGFLGFLLFKIIEHLAFRARVLRDAIPAEDPNILRVWEQELEQARVPTKKPICKLVISPCVSTPLTLGLFRRSMRLVLPRQNYTTEELSLVLRHELVHICRDDTWAKFFLVFCTAMCWFNPLMWIAMKKSAEDLELSCDETVLIGTDNTVRKQYAGLVLSAAGDGAGFTSCLSAAASALRYRLKHIVAPRPLRSGAFTVGVVIFVLYLSCGYVTLAFERGTAAETVFCSQDLHLYSLASLSDPDDPDFPRYDSIRCTDPQELTDYLAGLRTDLLEDISSPNLTGRRLILQYDGPNGLIGLTLSTHQLKVVDFSTRDYETAFYHLPDGVDWEYLDSIILTAPYLRVHYGESGDHFPRSLRGTIFHLTKEENGVSTLLQERDSAESSAGVFGGDTPEQATLEFSLPLAKPFSVKVENWDRTHSYTIDQDERLPSSIITLPPYSAHYTVYATLDGGNGITYEAEFRFEFGDLNRIETQ